MKPVTVSDRRLSELSLKMVRQYPGRFEVPLSESILRHRFGACRIGVERAYQRMNLTIGAPFPAGLAFRKVTVDSAKWVLERLALSGRYGAFLRAVVADTLEIIAGLRGRRHQREDLLAVASRLRRKTRPMDAAKRYMDTMRQRPGYMADDGAYNLMRGVLYYPGVIPTTDFLMTYRPVLAAVIDRRVAA